nr:hypothetical protein GCM10020093_044910 [Planobispora longispora]
METWVAYHRGTPAGYAELVPQDGAAVEVASFGLMHWAIGKGAGGRLLEFCAARAWDLAERRPDREPTRRVWLHTCSLDGPAALPAYQARGFRIYDSRLNVPGDEDEGVTPAPGPAPPARRLMTTRRPGSHARRGDRPHDDRGPAPTAEIIRLRSRIAVSAGQPPPHIPT